jgi:hypothetical protein
MKRRRQIADFALTSALPSGALAEVISTKPSTSWEFVCIIDEDVIDDLFAPNGLQILGVALGPCKFYCTGTQNDLHFDIPVPVPDVSMVPYFQDSVLTNSLSRRNNHVLLP